MYFLDTQMPFLKQRSQTAVMSVDDHQANRQIHYDSREKTPKCLTKQVQGGTSYRNPA